MYFISILDLRTSIQQAIHTMAVPAYSTQMCSPATKGWNKRSTQPEMPMPNQACALTLNTKPGIPWPVRGAVPRKITPVFVQSLLSALYESDRTGNGR